MPGQADGRSRAETAADTIGSAARRLEPGVRLGSREELRRICGVSIGTLHEALRLLQSTGEVAVRSGPGGGVFAGERTALAGLLRDVRSAGRAGIDFGQTSRVLHALAPLVLRDAVETLDEAGEQRLQRCLDDLVVTARSGALRVFVRASLEVFATIVSMPSTALLPLVAGSIVRAQIELLPRIEGTVDGTWRPLVTEHLDAVVLMVRALRARDPESAIAVRATPGFDALFHALHAQR